MTTNTIEQLKLLADHATRLAPENIGGIFHAHLTVTAASDQLPALGDFCRGQRAKLTIVDLEKDTRQQRDVMTTSYYRESSPGSLGRIISKLTDLANVLDGNGYPVVRAKLEHETRPTLTAFSRAQYHEVHIKLAIPAESFSRRRRQLAELGKAKGFVASNNPRERTGDLVMQFVNLRIYEGDQTAADARVQDLVTGLETEAFVVRETKQETVIFDTNLALDEWWA